MARRGRRISDKADKAGYGKVPKLEPGDEVPKTGKFRLDEGIRVKPVHHFKSSQYRVRPYKPPRMRKLRGISTGRGRKR